MSVVFVVVATRAPYNGAIAFAVTGLFFGAAGYATFATACCLAGPGGSPTPCGPLRCLRSAMYGGAVDCTHFYNAGGWRPVVIAKPLAV